MKPDAANDLYKLFKGITEQLNDIRRIKPTHCFDIVSKIARHIPVTEIHATAFGMRSVVAWEDGRQYELLITPIKEEGERHGRE